MTKLARAIAQQEGFFVKGTKPQRDHNPGDLKHGPRITGWDGEIGIEPSDDAGWSDLERQIQLDAERGLTLAQFIGKFAPPCENDTNVYLRNVSRELNAAPDTPLKDLLNV